MLFKFVQVYRYVIVKLVKIWMISALNSTFSALICRLLSKVFHSMFFMNTRYKKYYAYWCFKFFAVNLASLSGVMPAYRKGQLYLSFQKGYYVMWYGLKFLSVLSHTSFEYADLTTVTELLGRFVTDDILSSGLWCGHGSCIYLQIWKKKSDWIKIDVSQPYQAHFIHF